MSAPLRKGRALAQQRLVGLAFLLLIAALVGVTVGLYQKAFTPVVMVSLQADRIGNQLTQGADVKLRGMLVGEVRSVRSNGDHATIELALSRDHVGLIPADISAMLLPKTLFGEKYVALQLPGGTGVTGTAGRAIRSGDVITQDRSSTARETAKAVDDLLPLLQALKPAALSVTLNALSGALRGRGDKIGANFARVDTYLAQLNPALPTLARDNAGIADFADTVNRALPSVLEVLDNLSFSSRSLVDQQSQLAGFLRSTAGFTNATTSLLHDNGPRFVQLAADSLPSLKVYERYSPGTACLLTSIAASVPAGEASFGGKIPGLHITLGVVQDQGTYAPTDTPKFGEDRGPTCFGLGPKHVVPFPATYAPVDGYCDPQESAHPGTTGNCHARSPTAGLPAAAMDPATVLAGSQVLERALVATSSGVPYDAVPDIAVLLFGPVARGTTASVRS